MSKEEAYNILEQAVNAGLLKGVYTLPDMNAIIKALEILKPLNNK